MIKKVLNLIAWFVSAVLLTFTLRRWLFIFFTLLPGRKPAAQPGAGAREVLLLASIRNEEASLPKFLEALDQLTYPCHKLTIVLIDDGSTDGSRALIQGWVAGRQRRHALLLAENVGKAAALATALRHFPQGEIIAVYDADERPTPTALDRLIAPFADEGVGGVSGRRAVNNALVSPAASYTTFEGLVHQLITMRAKDRLDLAPALLGANCAYRRSALVEAGSFKPNIFLEDSDLTLKLARAGWRIRFEPAAVSYHRVPQSLAGYWRQHTRWARGFNEVAKEQAVSVLGDRRLSPALRLELLIFALGYLDRVALLAGAGLALFKPVRGRLVATLLTSLLTPLFQIIIALYVSREPAAMWRKIIWVPLFFGLDVAMAAGGLWTTLMQTPKIWEERRMRK